MEPIFDFFLKFNLSIILIYLFYVTFLSKLTHFDSNRFYFLISLLFSFSLPFIKIDYLINDVLTNTPESLNNIPSLVDIKQSFLLNQNQTMIYGSFGIFDILLVIYISVFLILFIQFFFQIITIISLKNKSVSDYINNVLVQRTDVELAPFSFCKYIFINPKLHSNEELNEILLHENKHVKDWHSLDILLIELLVLFNWFNPFIWLLRRSIKQNLEFLADAHVISQINNKKHYQYHLLKISLKNPYSITIPFNYLQLKTRILMINRIKTPQKSKFVFALILPLFSLLIFSFRERVLKLNFSDKPQNNSLLKSSMIINTKEPNQLSDIKEKVANEYSICGSVFDYKTSKPLEGMKITLKETGKFVTTDKDGYFEIKAQLDEKILSKRTLVLSYENNTREILSPGSSYSSGISTSSVGELRTYFLDINETDIVTRFSSIGEIKFNNILGKGIFKKAFEEAIIRKNQTIEEYEKQDKPQIP